MWVWRDDPAVGPNGFVTYYVTNPFGREHGFDLQIELLVRAHPSAPMLATRIVVGWMGVR